MTIKDIHDLFDLVSDKEMRGYLSPEEKDSFLDRASMWMMGECKRIYGMNVDTHECMAPFVSSYEFDGVDFVAGVLSIPAAKSFLRLSAITLIVNDGEKTSRAAADVVNPNELGNRLSSQLNEVSDRYPVAVVVGVGKWKIYTSINAVEDAAGVVDFIRRPKKPQFKYSVAGRVITQDVAGSQDLEWGEGYINQVLFKALTLAGFKLNDVTLAEAGLTMQKLEQ